jgi:hypothetical protein
LHESLQPAEVSEIVMAAIKVNFGQTDKLLVHIVAFKQLFCITCYSFDNWHLLAFKQLFLLIHQNNLKT